MLVNGIPVGGALPPTANNFKGSVMVVGSGKCLWDDIEAVWRKLPAWQGDFLGVNWGGFWLPFPLKHLATLHPIYLKHWIAMRANSGIEGWIHTHSNLAVEGVENVWEFENTADMSGLFGVKVALGLGYSEVIVVGMPMDGTGHFYDPPQNLTIAGHPPVEIPNYSASASREAWERANRHEFKGRVKSMSGMTRDILGEP